MATRGLSAAKAAVADSRLSGSCFCGAIRFSVTPPTLFCGHCHCSMCRRSHGAAFVTWFAVPPERFLLERDAELARFASSTHGTRSFCRRCGSTLFCESSHHPDVVDIHVIEHDSGSVANAESAHGCCECLGRWHGVFERTIGIRQVIGEIGETEFEPGAALTHVGEQAPCTAVQIVHGEHV